MFGRPVLGCALGLFCGETIRVPDVNGLKNSLSRSAFFVTGNELEMCVGVLVLALSLVLVLVLLLLLLLLLLHDDASCCLRLHTPTTNNHDHGPLDVPAASTKACKASMARYAGKQCQSGEEM